MPTLEKYATRVFEDVEAGFAEDGAAEAFAEAGFDDGDAAGDTVAVDVAVEDSAAEAEADSALELSVPDELLSVSADLLTGVLLFAGGPPLLQAVRNTVMIITRLKSSARIFPFFIIAFSPVLNCPTGAFREVPFQYRTNRADNFQQRKTWLLFHYKTAVAQIIVTLFRQVPVIGHHAPAPPRIVEIIGVFVITDQHQTVFVGLPGIGLVGEAAVLVG